MMPPTQRRSAADHDPRRCPIVGNGIEDFALVLQARIDDLDRRHDIFSGGLWVDFPEGNRSIAFLSDVPQQDPLRLNGLNPPPKVDIQR